jgi:signal transduction histidine kinase/pSer/pThr/pTyr-binding forkhead associated (FHA) protein
VPRLIVIKGADEGKQFDLNALTVGVGRDSSNAVRLHDTEVSRRHAEFRQMEGGAYRLLDIGSVNGTYVNNQPIKEAVLQPGDHIQIGQTILVYSVGRPSSPGRGDLADRISMITRPDSDLSSAIVKTVSEVEGSRILARPDQAHTLWLKTNLANLSIMYETIQAVSHILDIDQLLERIMELIFRSIEADRGCIMLRNPDSGQLEPKAVRWREKVDGQEKMAVSRSIMDYVLREKQGVLVNDAAADERFNTGASIVRYGIREAICVPMKGRHASLGVLYLDTHSQHRDLAAGKTPAPRFTEDHLTLAIAIAHQAALAIEDTRYHQAMVQAERLAAIGQTIAALSHHIKNILQGLRSGGEILKMGLGEMNEQLLQQGWKIVEKNQVKIYDLVMDMLSYSKEREPAIEPTELNQVAEDVVELMRGRARELGAKLELRTDPGLPVIQADPEGIHRALLNIVSNAIDAVEGRPNAQVGVAPMLDPDAGWVRIVVVDNGIGIPPGKLGEIFKPFVSTKGAKGTGLGLAVSRKILREHGGDIVVQSQQGKGSKFILRLPIKSPLSPDSAAVRSQNPPVPPPE